jgi:hypothetical protein
VAAAIRRQVSRGGHPAGRHRHPAPRCYLLRRANIYQAGLMAGRHLGHLRAHALGGQGRGDAAPRPGAAPDPWCARAWPEFAPVSRRRCTTMPRSSRIVTLDGDGQFKTSLEKVRAAPPPVQGPAACWWGRRNDASALGRGPCVPGGGTGRIVRDRRAERGAGRARRAARAPHPAHRFRGLLPGALRRRAPEAGPGDPHPSSRRRPRCSSVTSS